MSFHILITVPHLLPILCNFPLYPNKMLWILSGKVSFTLFYNILCPQQQYIFWYVYRIKFKKNKETYLFQSHVAHFLYHNSWLPRGSYEQQRKQHSSAKLIHCETFHQYVILGVPIVDDRSRNKRRNLWVGRCVSSWWPWFPSRSTVLIYIYIYIYIYVHSLYEFCYRSYIQREGHSV